VAEAVDLTAIQSSALRFITAFFYETTLKAVVFSRHGAMITAMSL